MEILDFKIIHASDVMRQIGNADGYIEYPSAFFAYKVMMLVAIVIVMSRAIEIADI